MITEGALLSAIPTGLRDPLIAEFKGITVAFMEGRWKLASLDAGRFCEVAYTILDGAVSGTFAASPAKPARFVDACRALESRPAVGVGDRSLRILIPRVLPAMYEIRNNRNVGHVGGDVSSNEMDASFVRESATWVVAELVRIFHNVTVSEAQSAVTALVERRHPLVWEMDGVRRVLSPEMTAKDRALVLLYSRPGWVGIKELESWVKYSRNFVRQVLRPLAEDLLVELDESKARVTITPLGIAHVESRVLSR